MFRQGGSVRGYLKSAVLVLVLLLLISFGLKNQQGVQIFYFFGFSTAEVPLYAMVYLCVFIGILIGLAAAFPGRHALRKRVRGLKQENAGLQADLNRLTPPEPGEEAGPAEI